VHRFKAAKMSKWQTTRDNEPREINILKNLATDACATEKLINVKAWIVALTRKAEQLRQARKRVTNAKEEILSPDNTPLGHPRELRHSAILT
jgi:hypothetical protein